MTRDQPEAAADVINVALNNKALRRDSQSSADFEALTRSLPLFIDVAKFYTSGDERAIKARRMINKKQGRTKPFHASIWVDLTLLHEAVGRDSSLKAEQPEQFDELAQATRSLLQVLDEDFVCFPDDASVDSDSSVLYDHQPYAGLQRLLDLSDTHEHGRANDERLDWLCTHIRLKRPKVLAQERITEHVRRCYRLVRVSSRPGQGTLIKEPLEDQSRFASWRGAKMISENLDRLYVRLRDTWICTCNPSHVDTKFSLDMPQISDPSKSRCTVVYQTCRSTRKWRRARLEIRNVKARNSRGQPDFTALCHKLEMANVANRNTKFEIQTGHMLIDHHACCEPVSLDLLLDPSQPDNLASLPRKARLILALLISYFYLHLSGGPWWPYHRVDHFTWMWKHQPSDRISVSSPLFAAPLRDQTLPIVPKTEQGMNSHMPSLPSLGKTLLGITMARKITWDNIDSALEEYEKDEAFAEEIMGVVCSCLGTDDLTFKTGGCIRDDESMRLAFTARVVMKLQHILTVGYKVDILATLNEITREAEVSADSIATLSKGVRGLELQAHTVESPENQVNDRDVDLTSGGSLGDHCLHHDGMVESVKLLNEDEARSASQWLTDLQNCVRKSKSRYASDNSETKPVRIAVIDTGALIDDDSLDFKFDGRLKEYRTWLDESAGALGTELSEGTDDVGHGTHATSLVLQTTMHTNCEVYIGQVFATPQDRQSASESRATQIAIARAIEYAVCNWKVDIISMSFGYPSIVPVIDEMIDKYASKVLIFAAASNCGGNAPISWPARHDNVISVFATDGEGNYYRRNPTPRRGPKNFAVLGYSVEGHWPPDVKGSHRLQHKSGTSCAAPIAAGIAGIIIDLMRTRRELYLDTRIPVKHPRTQEGARQRQEQVYEQRLRSLKKPWGMKAVLALMAEKRQEYDYIAPRLFFDDDSEDMYVVQRILTVLKHI